jgi:hypothetical protein
MSRDDGFAVMDISTSIHEDQKFKRLARRHPELAAPAFLAYVATLAESWRGAELVSVEDAWPSLIPYDRAVILALRRFELVDRDGLVADETWDRWFGPALERKRRARERWARANAKRHAALMADDADTAAAPRGTDEETAGVPRGNSAVTGAIRPSVPSDPSVPSESREIPPPPAERGRRKNGSNARARGTAPRDTGANPRANGHSPRQEREREKRGGLPPTVGEILRRAAAEGRP